MATELENGLLIGLLVGEGHFGGDGRQAQVTLRMHVKHEAMFRWIERTFPGGKLYGPYDHGGRHYYQWMARGPFLRDVLIPLLGRLITPEFDEYSHGRLYEMVERYNLTVDQIDGGSVASGLSESRTPEAREVSVPEKSHLDVLFGRLRGAEQV